MLPRASINFRRARCYIRKQETNHTLQEIAKKIVDEAQVKHTKKRKEETRRFMGM